MSTLKLSGSVGFNADNQPADVKTVRALLNGFVQSGQLAGFPILPIDETWPPILPYIEKFQKAVAGFPKPDRKIDKNGTTWKKLIEPPKNPWAGYGTCLWAYLAMVRSPLDSIKPDLWSAALKALVRFSDHPKLLRPEIVTMVDFRISRQMPRLWTVNIKEHTLLHHAWCAHGTNSGKKDLPNAFGDGDKKTSLGAYITRVKYEGSMLGHVKTPQPALKLDGLEKGINGRALERGILFHAATYVKPNNVGNSWGCFSTPVDQNHRIVSAISGGSFVYAYAG